MSTRQAQACRQVQFTDNTPCDTMPSMKPVKQPRKPKQAHSCHSRHRLSAQLGATLLACMTGIVARGCKMRLLPSMKRVVSGTEPVLDGESTWDCKQPPEQCYASLMEVLGLHALMECSKDGIRRHELTRGISQLMRPQTWGSSDNLTDSKCHMPACKSFSPTDTFTPLHGPTYWYTWVTLGRDKHGEVVRETAHRLIAAARFGVPHSLFDKSLPRSRVHQALHLPVCPALPGGCCNPLHLRWAYPKHNVKDQSIMRLHKQGPKVARVLLVGKPKPSVMLAPCVPVARRVTRSQTVSQA